MREVVFFSAANSGEYSEVSHAQLTLSTEEVHRIISARRVLSEAVRNNAELKIEKLVIDSGKVSFGRLDPEDVRLGDMTLRLEDTDLSRSDFKPLEAVALDIQLGEGELAWHGCERYSGEGCDTRASWEDFELAALSHGLVRLKVGEDTPGLVRRLADLRGLGFKAALSVLADHLDELDNPDWVSARLRACASSQELTTIKTSQFLKDLLAGGGS